MNDRAIAYGGIPHSPDVWVLEHVDGLAGTPTWHRLAPAGPTPPPRHGHGVAYDPFSNRLMVFGGCAGGCFPTLNDVWVLTNANGLGGTPEWINLSPPGGPSGRVHPGVAYDPAANRLIVFGGQDGGGFGGSTFPEVWVLSNANGLGGLPAWQRLMPLGSTPPGQYGPTVAYDTATNRLTTFGGSAQGSGLLTNAVWVLEHANGIGGTPAWFTLIPEGAPGSPPPNAFVRGGLDEPNNRLHVVGSAPDYVWTLDGSNGTAGSAAWTHVAAAAPAPPSPIGLLAFNAVAGTITVFEPSREFVWVLGGLAPSNAAPIANAGSDQVVEASSAAGAAITLDGSASIDPDGDPLTYTWSGPFGTLTGVLVSAQLPIGSWLVSLTVDDGRGGTATDIVAINVIDTTPPIVKLTVSTATLWAPNNKMVPVTVTAEAADAVGAPACSIVSVSSSEPPSPDQVDWQITGPLSVSLRATREGSGNGRTYSIVVTCSDAAGNETTSAVPVFVPHDRR